MMQSKLQRLCMWFAQVILCGWGTHALSHAQSPAACLTQVSPAQTEYLRATAEARNAFTTANMRTGIRWIPVKMHIIRQSNGSGGITDLAATAALAYCDSVFRGLNIQFYECGARNYILSDTWYTFEQTEEFALTAAHEVANVLNIYIYGSGPVGYTYLPPGPDRMLVDDGTSKAIWVHELGHYFGLMHTHGNYNAGNGTDELVNGSNCSTAGDMICDTPADPNLFNKVNSSCMYTGTDVDANGQAYTPDPRNWMAYVVAGNCRDRFSPTQRQWLTYGALYDRANLNCTAPAECSNTVEVFPYAESWENTLGLWTQNTDDQFDWTLRTGGTPTASSGPDAAAVGSYYLYIEATGNTGSKWATVTSPCFDLHKVVNPRITFRYNAFGANCDSLAMDVSTDGNTWVRRWGRTGNTGSPAWVQQTVDIADLHYSGTLRVRFRARTAASGDLGDIALDDFRIASAPCAGTTVTTTATDITCAPALSGAAAVTATGTASPWTYRWNTGATTASLSGLSAGLYTCTVTDQTGCLSRAAVVVEQRAVGLTATAGSSNGIGMNDGSLNLTVNNPAGANTYHWSQGATTEDLTGIPAGTYTVTVTSGTCTVTERFGVPYASRCVNGVVSTFPYYEGFEAGTGLLYNEPATDDYNVETVSASAYGSMLSAAMAGSGYAYAETGTRPGDVAILATPCLDFSLLSDPRLEFALYKSGSGVGSLEVLAELPDGSTTRVLYSGDGVQMPWTLYQSNTLPYAGMSGVRLLFIFTTGVDAMGEMAIDEFVIRDCAGTTVNMLVTDETCVQNNGQITAQVTGNAGPYTYRWTNGTTAATLSGLDAGTYGVTVTAAQGCLYKRSAAITNYTALASIVSTTAETAPGASNGTADLTVSGGRTPYTYRWSNGALTQDLSGVPGGTYTCTVTDNAGCTHTRTATISTLSPCTPAVSTFPYSESFESGLGIWSQTAGDNFDWTRTNVATPTKNTGPDAAAQGAYFLYTEATGFCPSKTAFLESQCFNLTAAASASFSFRYHLYGNSMGTLTLKYTTNQGSTWVTAWGPTTGNTNAWQTATVSLPVGQYVKLRFEAVTGSADRSDIGMDQFSLTTAAAREMVSADPVTDTRTALSLWPNPSEGNVHLRFTAAQAHTCTLRVLSLTGQVLFTETFAAQAGENEREGHWENLPAGVYLLELSAEDSREMQKFVITGN